ncbi:MAG: hypothetical protein J5833_08975 [Victivallales bacterium]|nr:hypothetical protein [Victivallales bacterium]
MKKLLAFAIAFVAFCAFAVELARPEHQKMWRFPQGEQTIGDDGVSVPFEGDMLQVVVSGLEVQQAEECLLVLKYRLSKDAKMFYYVENHTPPNWQNKGVNVTGDGKFKTIFLPFRFDKPVKGNTYTVMRLFGKGTLDVKSLVFVKDANFDGRFFNSDLAEGEAGWTFERNAKIVADADGKNTLELWAQKEGDFARAVTPQAAVKPLHNYRLSYKATGITGFGKKSIEHDLRMYPLDRRNAPLANSDRWQTCLDGRTQVKSTEFLVPAQHTQIAFAVETRGPARVQFSDFKIEEIAQKSQVAELQLDMPFNYRDGVFATNPSKSITGRVEILDESAKSAELSLLSDGKSVFSRSYDGKGGAFEVPAPAPAATSELALSVKDADGKVIHTEKRLLHNYPQNPVEVTFNEEGVTLVNGKPFFHIGNWWFTNRGDEDDDMEFLKEAGFNVIFLPNKHPDRFPLLDLTRRHGLYGIIELPHDFPKTAKTDAERDAFFSKWKALVEQYKTHPSLFGYFGPDEAMLAGAQIDTMVKFYRLARDNDPYHPLWFNEAPVGLVSELKSYAKDTCDVFGVDIYPLGAPHGSDLGDRSMTVVGLHTDRCMEAVERRKPVWMILQGFSWAHMRHPANTKPASEVPEAVYPTYEQTRFMAFNSILHGATGIQYHYLGYTVYLPDEFWKGIRRTTLELKYLTPVLTARTLRGATAKCDNGKVRMMVKQLDGVNYYILANESPNAIKAEFSGFTESSLNVIFATEPVALKNGAFSLELEPYAVRVLSAAPFAPSDEIWQKATYRPYSARLKNDVRK